MRDVRFEFRCHRGPHDKTLTYMHPLPDALLLTSTAQQHDPSYASQYAASVKPILLQHARACQEASDRSCVICASPVTTVLQTPMAYLHLDPPMVQCLVFPVCGKQACDLETRTNAAAMIGRVTAKVGGGEPLAETMLCKRCGTAEGLKRCGGCGIVAYCGRECQRLDWRMGHKQACRA